MLDKRLTVEQASQLSSNVYLALSDDGDYVEIRLLVDNMDDVPIFGIHEVDIGGNQKRKVICLKSVDGHCPLCKEGNKPVPRIELPVLVDNDIRIFERGMSFVNVLKSAARKYKILSSQYFELERIGRKGDVNTTYLLTSTGVDKEVKSYKDLATNEEIENVLKQVLSEWTEDDMEYYIDNGTDPHESSSTHSTPIKRRSSHREEEPQPRRRVSTRKDDVEEEPQPRRRTVSNNNDDSEQINEDGIDDAYDLRKKHQRQISEEQINEDGEVDL